MTSRFAVALLLLMLLPVPASAGRDVGAELEQVRQERLRLTEVRRKLDAQLGELGRDLRTLDAALVTAREALHEAAAKVAESDRRLAELNRRMGELQARADTLHERMLAQSAAAYRRIDREPGWLDAMAGVPVTEIPHRRYMLQQLLQSQQADRRRWQQTVAELATVRSQVAEQRDVLEVQRRAQAAAEAEAEARVAAKRSMVRKVRDDIRLKSRRDKQLAEQEQALQQLLNGIGDVLLASDRARPLHMRSSRGRLPWPLRGKVVARFGSVPAKGRPRLSGVQLAPYQQRADGRKVRAIAAGQVRYADWFGGFGLMMIVDHGDGLMTVYAHNDALYKQLGDWVEAGEALGEAGSTGWISDVRLYFEVRDKGKPVDPGRWCRR